MPAKKSKKLKLAVLQMTSTNDVARNFIAIQHAISECKAKKCDILCTPENSLFFRINGHREKMQTFTLREPSWRELQSSVDKAKIHVLIGSVAYQKNNKVTNATVLLSPGEKPKVVYEKIHLFDVDVPGAPVQNESATFDSGKKPQVITIHGWRIGLSICYDMRFSELYTQYAKKDVDLIVAPSSFLVPTGKAHWHTLLKARAIESQCYVVAAAQSGGHADPKTGVSRETFGHSLVVDPWGNILVDIQREPFGSQLQIAELEESKILQVRSRIPMKKHRRLK